jgi:hypothetical protein
MQTPDVLAIGDLNEIHFFSFCTARDLPDTKTEIIVTDSQTFFF